MTADTRWLDEDEQQTWRAFLTAQRLLFDRLERQLQRDAGLPHAYYEILVRLSEAPDRTLRMSQLADSLAVVAQPALARRRADGGGGLGAPPGLCRGPTAGRSPSSPPRAWRKLEDGGARARRGRPRRPVRRARP